MFEKELLVPDYGDFSESKLQLLNLSCFAETLEMFLDNQMITKGKLDILFPKNNHSRLFMSGVSAFFQEMFPNVVETKELEKNTMSFVLKKMPKSGQISRRKRILSISITDNFNAERLFGIDWKIIDTVEIVMSPNISSSRYGYAYQKKAEAIIQTLYSITKIRKDINIHYFSVFSNDKVFLDKIVLNDEIMFPQERFYVFNPKREVLYSKELLGVHFTDLDYVPIPLSDLRSDGGYTDGSTNYLYEHIKSER